MLQEGVRRGSICCRTEPMRMHFSVRCPDWGAGLYKVWLVNGDRRMLLGTLEPSGCFLVLERHCSLDSLRCAGVYPPERGDLSVIPANGRLRAPRGWESQKAMPLQPSDREVERALKKSNFGWYQRLERGWLLCWPWRVGEEFPVPSLACVGWMDEINGQNCFLVQLNEKGWPQRGTGHAGKKVRIL